MDIATWLRGLGLAQYERAFRDNAIDAETLPRLTAEDLKELGVAAIGHRRRLLDAITALGGGTPATALRPAPPAEPGAERRHVTVLFADLTGYTALSRELDPEQVHALLGHFFEAVDGVVEEHGGMVDKHVGDCVMAVFGAPVAHTDDPERAVRAALAIHAAVRQAGEAAGRPLAVHVGVASGHVVAGGTGSTGHRQYTVTGEAANLASRLMGLAGPGDTLLADAVRGLLADRLDAEVVGEVALKGLDRPARGACAV